jgi:biotin carboxyl carrier protein
VKRLTLVSKGVPFPLEIGESEGRLRILLEGKPLVFDLDVERGGGLTVVLGGRCYEAQVRVQEGSISVELDGLRYAFEPDEPGRATAPRATDGEAHVLAPMPGKVVKLLAAAGEVVRAHQGILLFEAMKMQNEIRSPLAGKVVSMAVREGQTVESRDRLFTVRTEG